MGSAAYNLAQKGGVLIRNQPLNGNEEEISKSKNFCTDISCDYLL